VPTSPAEGNITASTAGTTAALLDLMVEEFQQLARQDGSCGILVTKAGPGRFIVELSDDVPCGLTLEHSS